MFKDYIQDLGRYLILAIGAGGLALAVGLWGQPLDKSTKMAIAIFFGILGGGGVVGVTIKHSRTWKQVISEHYAPSTVEIDMDNLQQRISEVQKKDS
jgi:hypothetical protein